MNKLLTIIVPIYNVEEYLHKCLDSLVVPGWLEQIEVLAIIDGSPDNSIAIAREFEAKYPDTFRVIEKENGGHGSALNLGLREAQGKYTKILDSDDWFDKENMPTFMQELSKTDADLILTDVVYEYPDRKEYVQVKDLHSIGEYKIDEILKAGNKTSRFIFLHNSTFKTELLRLSGIRFVEKMPFDDIAFFWSPLKTIETVKLLDINIYHYLLGREGQSIANLTEEKIEKLRFIYQNHVNEYMTYRSQLSETKRVYTDYLIKEVETQGLLSESKGVSIDCYVDSLFYWYDFLYSLKDLDIQDMSFYPRYKLLKHLPRRLAKLLLRMRLK